MSKRILSVGFAAVLFWCTAIVLAQEQAAKDYNWLNGTWEGAPPGGWTMQMELKVDKGNQVKGSEHIVQREGKRQNSRQIGGTVNVNKVDLEFFAPTGL